MRYNRIMKKRRILFVTERRADYSRLNPLLQAAKASKRIEPLLVVAGAHLLEKLGKTKNIIRKDGFHIDEELPTLGERDPDTGEAMAKAFGRAVMGMANIITKLKPDVVCTGFDLGCNLAAAIVSMHMNIPVAHIEGGGQSGSIDEVFRHALTKFSHIHFPASAEAKKRIIRLGENPRYVFAVGSLSLDAIKKNSYMPRAKLFQRFKLNPAKKLILFLQHPVTTEVAGAKKQIQESIAALRGTTKRFDIQVFAILGNSDAGGRGMARALVRSGIRTEPNVAHEDFLSFMKVADVLVGNSSAGIQEAPSFGLPVVNIGTRQQFRERGVNVIDVPHERKEIVAAIKKSLFDEKFIAKAKRGKNPYEGGNTAKKIVKILETIELPPIQKVMYN